MDDVRDIMSAPIFLELFAFVLAIAVSILLVDQVEIILELDTLRMHTHFI